MKRTMNEGEMDMTRRDPLQNWNLRNAMEKEGFSAVPLQPGAVYEAGKSYWCSYWSRWYQVLGIRWDKREIASVTGKWQDGEIGTHATPLRPAEDWEIIWPDGEPHFHTPTGEPMQPCAV